MSTTNFVKSSAALLISALCAVPAMAESNVNFYGRANASFQMSDDGEGSFTEVQSNASRLGINSDVNVYDDVTLFIKLEVQIDIDGDQDETFTARNQYIGVRGNYGELTLGKIDTVTKRAQGRVDLFNDHEGDIKTLFNGENRMSDTVRYKTPVYNGFQLGVAYMSEGDADSDAGYAVAATYGDQSLKKSKVYAAIGSDSEVNGYDVLRGVFSTKVAGITLGAMVQTQENLTTGEEMDGFFVSGAYKINKYTIKAQYQAADYDDKGDLSGATIGLDYMLAKNARLYTFYTTFDMDTSNDRDYAAVGIEYKF